MSPNALREEILRLPPAERLRLVEDIWDSLTASPESVGLPESHARELDRRLAEPGEVANLTWDEVRARRTQ